MTLAKQDQITLPMNVPSSSPLASLPSQQRIKYFSTTCMRNTHYQTLGVPQTASKSQIKVRVRQRHHCVSLLELSVESQSSLIFTRSHNSEYLPTNVLLIHIVSVVEQVASSRRL